MKKIGMINQPVASVIAGLGHLDMLVIGDSGLPIPPGVQRIDLAVSRGVPSFLQVLDAVLEEMKPEKWFVASEMEARSPQVLSALQSRLQGVIMEQVSHEEFKAMCKSAVAVIRTGEYTPYANVILVAGVNF